MHQVTLEQSMAGKKEVHLNLLRDVDGNTIVISSSEDIEPVGIHTGDSISIIPVQTIRGILLVLFRCKQLVINFFKKCALTPFDSSIN